MAEVSQLKVAARPVNEDALKMVEETLARVKSGEVTSVGIVEVRSAGEVAFAHSRTDQYHSLNSGAARMAASLANSAGDP